MSSTTVAVTGLPAFVTADDVMDFFSRVGHVLSVQLPTSDAGQNNSSSNASGAVLVVFEKTDDAASAEAISGSDFQDDVPVQVTAYPPPSSAAPVAASVPSPTVVESMSAPGAPNPETNIHLEENTGSGSGNSGPATATTATQLISNASETQKHHPSPYRIVVYDLPRTGGRDELMQMLRRCGSISDHYLTERRKKAYVAFTEEVGMQNALKLDKAQLGDGSVIRVMLREESEEPARSARGDVPPIPARAPRGDSANLVPKGDSRSIVVFGILDHMNRHSLLDFYTTPVSIVADLHLESQKHMAFLRFTTPEGAEAALRRNGEKAGLWVARAEYRRPPPCRRCGRTDHFTAHCKAELSRVQTNEQWKRRRSRSRSSRSSSSERGGGRRHRDHHRSHRRHRHRRSLSASSASFTSSRSPSVSSSASAKGRERGGNRQKPRPSRRGDERHRGRGGVGRRDRKDDRRPR